MMKNIMDEWFSSFTIKKSKRETPKDKYVYKISKGVIDNTNLILNDYGKLNPPNEGFVYWAGTLNDNIITVNTIIIPETDSDEQRVTVKPESNFYVVKSLSENKLIHIGQVHSHPGTWIDHSYGDNEWTSFKREGLISIVVPNYSKDGLLPLTICGVHRYHQNNFIRLSKMYINSHFQIQDGKFEIIDLRDKNNARWTK